MDSKHFVIQEFVPPAIYTYFGERSWWYISPVIVGIADHLRQVIGQPLIINNWHRGGSWQFRGYRPPQTEVGAAYSMHRLGLAIDVSSPGLTPPQLIRFIEQEKEKFIEIGLTTIEMIRYTPTWLHLDCRPRIEGLHPANDFLFVKP